MSGPVIKLKTGGITGIGRIYGPEVKLAHVRWH
jgi:hypothetical protein